MSYDIELQDPVTKEVIEVDNPHFMQGGTYAIGGSKELWLNVTYNYSEILYKVMGKNGIRSIYGLTGAKSIPILKSAIAKLNDNVNHNYWKATEGNVKQSLIQLLTMAEMRPDGVWSGD